MKTSNKILIGFAAALILIPILGMVYTSRVYYKDRVNSTVPVEDMSVKQLTTSSKGYFTRDLTAFNKILIPDGKNLYIQLSIVNSDKYGIKIPDDFKNSILYVVKPNGELEFKFDDKLDRSANDGYGVIIVIYTPKMNEINVANLGTFTFNAQLDSLSLKARNTQSLNFGSAITYHNHIGQITNNSFVRNLSIELYDTVFQSQDNSFTSLKAVAAKKSELMLSGDENQIDKFYIDELSLKASDNVSVKIENILIKNSTADISDDTKVDVPTYVLKQMFKK